MGDNQLAVSLASIAASEVGKLSAINADLVKALRIARDFIGGSDATWDGEVAALEAIDAALSAASGRAPTNKEE